MWLVFAAVLMQSAPGAESPVGADQFVRILGGAASDIRSVALAFEGRRRFVGPSGLTEDPDSLGMTFQGTYLFRSDGATLMDRYVSRLDAPQSPTHQIYAMLDARLETIAVTPDSKRSAEAMVEVGGPGSLRMPGSPEAILYLWYYRSLVLGGAGNRGYEFRGWETIDGQRCLVVQLDDGRARGGGDQPTVRLWIDMRRGFHPLKVEYHTGANLRVRIDGIRLEQCSAADGDMVWLPVAGTVSTFIWREGSAADTRYRDSPYFVEECRVIDGSVRVNAAMPDRAFAIGAGLGPFEVAKLKSARLQFDAIPPSRPPLRTDPEGVKLHLNQLLTEADHQADQLVASSAAREVWSWTHTLQLGLVALGIALLGVGLYRMRK